MLLATNWLADSRLAPEGWRGQLEGPRRGLPCQRLASSFLAPASPFAGGSARQREQTSACISRALLYTEAMAKTEVRAQALELPELERLSLAEELWASVEDPNAYPEALFLPLWQTDLLDQRLVESKDDPGKPWERVKAETGEGRFRRDSTSEA